MEGGAIICHDDKIKKRIDYLKNFGFADEVTVVQPGINAKMNEMQAALGLLQLKEIDQNIAKRQEVADLYREKLQHVKGIRFLIDIKGTKHNYSYFPVFVDQEKYGKSRDELYGELKENNIFGRRYFYPLISTFPIYRGLDSAKSTNLAVAEKIAEQVICLPDYPDLALDDVKKICDIIIGMDPKKVG